MYYWDETEWTQCSVTGVDTEENYIWVTLDDTTTPDLNYLSGGEFGGGEVKMVLDKELYKIGDIVTVAIHDSSANTRPFRIDTISVTVSSDFDTISEIILEETDVDTGIFMGTFGLSDTGTANQLVVLEDSTVTVNYQGVIGFALVDNVSPKVTGLKPEDGAKISDTTPLIEASVSDAIIAWMTLDDNIIATIGSGETLSYQVPALPVEVTLTEGVHTVLVYSIDAAGNTNQTTWSFTVDTTNPVATVNHNATGIVKAANELLFLFEFGETMDWRIAPTLSGNATTKLTPRTDPVGWVTMANVTYYANYTVPAGFNGTVFMEMTGAKDLAGNEMYSANMSFYIDSLVPTKPDDLESTEAATAVNLTWDASEDLGSGMASYNIYKDTSYIGSVATGTLYYTDSGLSASGTLSYIVEAVDLAGNKNNSTALDVVFVLGEVTEWKISLSEGWNLISLPLIPDNSDIAGVLADVLDDIEIVWSYDEATSVWASYAPGTPSGLSEMVDGDGYWIKSLDDVTLTLSGTEMPEPPLMPPTYDLVAGWNLIGYKAMESMHAEDYLGTIVAADTIRIYGFAEGAYFGVSIGSDLVPGLGYWIAMTDVGTIYP